MPPTSTQSAQPDNNQAAHPSVASNTSGEESKQQTSEVATDSNEVNDQLHTPPQGTAERQAIMDSLREEFNSPRSSLYMPHRGSITFVVNYLKVHNGWAWMNAYPHSSDSSDSFGEYDGFLLHQVGDRWELMKRPEAVNDPNDPENLDYPTREDVKRIMRMYPSIPADIFPR
ncbi:MAG TPA: hypothetical protein VK619_17800 [Pyrinomonadaceae bacterium]|nr:hypothetical protein [Pyrinomonadaceae bacterium]